MPSNTPAGCGYLLKIVITFEQHGIFESNFHTYLSKHCSVTGMQKSDKALTSIILACRNILVKMINTLELYGIF